MTTTARLQAIKAAEARNEARVRAYIERVKQS